MTIYAASARFDHPRVLSEGELMQLAPSIFQSAAHSSRTSKFVPIPTIEVLRGLAKEGFFPVAAKQSGSRLPDRREFTKHLVRLRRLDHQTKYRVGGTVAEILLKNANDGTAAWDLLAGLFEILCMNSLVAQTSIMESMRVKHTGDAQIKVIEGTYRVLDVAVAALEKPAEWSQIQLEPAERKLLAEGAHNLRFADAEGKTHTPITPEQLLTVRREEDNQPNLWSTFNVIQENVIRGGLSAYAYNRQGHRRHITTRAVKGIDQDVKLNRELFTLATKMAELKQGNVA